MLPIAEVRMPGNTTARLELAKSETIAPKVPRFAYDRLSALWARSPLIAVGLAAALVLASIALVLIGPRYTGQAMIQFNFVREEATKDTRIAPTASVDAMAVLNNAAP